MVDLPKKGLSDRSEVLFCVFDRPTMRIRECSAGLAAFLALPSPATLNGEYVIKLFCSDSYQAFETYLMGQDFTAGGSANLSTQTGASHKVAMALSVDASDADSMTLMFIPIIDYGLQIEKLRKVMKSLRSKNERMTDFTALVIHDLRNALQPVLGGVEIFEDTVKAGILTNSSRMLLGQIHDGSRNMNAILDGLSQYLRLEIGDYPPELTDMNELVDALIQNARSSSKRFISITRSAELPRLVCEKPLIKQLFENLIDNAIKYTNGSAVQIEIGCGDYQKAKPIFFVKDRGVGISEKDRTRIFAPFQRADHHQLNKKGSGMGMALVKKIVERHGGEIWFDSIEQQGTTFWFSLSEHG